MTTLMTAGGVLAVAGAPSAAGAPTANDRLKEGFTSRVWASLIVATVLHALTFMLWPEMTVEPLGAVTVEGPEIVQLPPTDLPEEPATLARPLRPALDTDLVVHEVVDVIQWKDPVEDPPPPPDNPVAASGNTVPFVPRTLEPELTNTAQVQRALVREYPPTLRDAGIGGRVDLFIHVDVEGLVTEVRIAATSGMASLDEAALRVAHAMRFNPAMNIDKRVAVWIRLPVTFQVR